MALAGPLCCEAVDTHPGHATVPTATRRGKAVIRDTFVTSVWQPALPSVAYRRFQ